MGPSLFLNFPRLFLHLPSRHRFFFSTSLAGSIGSIGSSVTISASCVVNNSVEFSDSPITSARPEQNKVAKKIIENSHHLLKTVIFLWIFYDNYTELNGLFPLHLVTITKV